MDEAWKNVYLKSLQMNVIRKKICQMYVRIALLKYYSDKEYTGELEDVLHQVLREMCEKQLVFPYYMNYKEEWLREVQLYNKVMGSVPL